MRKAVTPRKRRIVACRTRASPRSREQGIEKQHLSQSRFRFGVGVTARKRNSRWPTIGGADQREVVWSLRRGQGKWQSQRQERREPSQVEPMPHRILGRDTGLLYVQYTQGRLNDGHVQLPNISLLTERGDEISRHLRSIHQDVEILSGVPTIALRLKFAVFRGHSERMQIWASGKHGCFCDRDLQTKRRWSGGACRNG